MTQVKIVDVRATTVAMPLEAPLRHAIGAHWGRFIRTVVEVETDNGIIGLGELGGGGESAEAAVRGLLPYLKGHDPLQLEQMRWKIMNPTASLYNNRMQIHAALEMACMDAAGKHLGIRACDLLGGAMRERVPFASYLFYRLPDEKTGRGGEVDPEEIVAHARALKAEHGFKAHKLKGGVFAPDHDVEVTRALGAAFPNDGLRLDPNAAWSVEEAIRVGRAIEDLRNDYFEDPTWGLEGMRRVRNFVRIPTATNTVVVNFEQLATNIRLEAIDVVLLDTTFWGGLRQAHKAGQVLETFQYGASVHSSGELGIQLASMLHLGAALSNLSFAADAHYHHLVDDVIVGGKMKYVDGSIAVPQGPGLGVELDREKLAQYAEHYREVGGYTYDRDPTRPDWYAVLPEQRWADPRAR
ncbi:mandelate racemase [Arsenicitalea aurantiaca]|uniref:glucarate dehydratase n=1 Tax=Arsenicitalea aurantiaca TaxID=1783274 RepID=A0A433XER3_9HYPH|nr:mandelate racemase [Arsenicitalea aurantiaca]